MIRVAAVDMVGTTVRERGLIDGAFRSALRHVGMASSQTAAGLERLRRSRGQAKREGFARLLGPDEAERAFRAFEEDVRRRVASGEVEALPGAKEALESLKADGVRVLMTTGFPPRIRDGILDRLGWSTLVDLALSPEDVGGQGRPAPDMVLRGLTRLGVDDPREAAVVGDTVHDLVAGSRAGAAVVAAVLTGAHTREELAAAPHTHILGSIEGFPEIVIGA